MVLLIDDEAAVRLPLRLLLERCGYRVIEALDGIEGLKLLAHYGDEIALVVVDLHMPKMSGAEVIREVRHRTAELPIVLISGFSPIESQMATAEPDAFLRKPFELADLVRTVRDLIGRSRRRGSGHRSSSE